MEHTDIEKKLKAIINNDELAKDYKNFVVFGYEDENFGYVFGEIIENNEYFIMHHFEHYNKFIEVLCEKLNVSLEELYNILKENDSDETN